MIDTLWDGLEDPDALDRATKPAKEQERFPCNVCSGTGRYQGRRTQQTKAHCFACKGAGYFKTSQGDRVKAKAQHYTRKAASLKQKLDAFHEQHEGLHAFLSEAGDWSEFARSLAEQIAQRGSLSEKQLGAARAMQAKVATRQAEGQKTRQEHSGTVDLAKIREMFDAAVASSLKRPVYRAEGLVLSLAPAHGKNPGAIYIKAGEEYLGKVLGTDFQAARAATDETLTSLQTIAADPLEAAVRYGRLTGACACCGRTLTDPKSVERGIGPICAGKWGL